MTRSFRLTTFRKSVLAGVAALGLVGALDGATPARALPVADPAALGDADAATVKGAIQQAYYGYYPGRRYYGYYPRRRFRYGYGYRRPVPCRGGSRTFQSRRYC